MGQIEFCKSQDEAWFLDVKENFARKRMTFERRRDPLTGRLCRVLPFRQRLPESSLTAETLELSRKNCPFCPEQIESLTPRLIPEIACEGRLRRGKAVLFPNAFPYARYNWVVVLSEQHWVASDQFTVEGLRDGFLVAQEGTRRVEESAPSFRYPSINWNYLPPAGAGLYHPHLQVVAEETPTASHREVLDALRRYQLDTQSFYWEDFLSVEMERGERYIGNRGDVHFMMAFSPWGIFGEIFILFAHRLTLQELTLEDWDDFSDGLTRVLKGLKKRAIESFNLAIYSGSEEEVSNWVYGRLCPRITLPPWGTSDINYFEKLHGEVFCLVSPEKMCEELRPFFLSVEADPA